jgi:methionyl-tRNA formyltransferase
MSDSTLRIVFMGTPFFAVPSLRALQNLPRDAALRSAVVAVVTQPDRPAGRGKRVGVSAVKVEALNAGLPVLQPENLRGAEGFALLESTAPDLIVVAAYAQILSRKILSLPRFGCINVHASLLPLYRGASPISGAIRDGRQETGVTIMQMEAGLDTGPIISQVRVRIEDEDTTESLTLKLADLGARELSATISPWVNGELVPRPQDSERASMTRPLRKDDGRIDWNLPAEVIARHVRAMFPWPGASTTAGGTLLKVLEVKPTDLPMGTSAAPGTLLYDGTDPLVQARAGAVRLSRVQPAGRKPMSGAEWLRGAPSLRGTMLGDVR